MRSYFVLSVILLSFLIISCSKKTLPVIPSRTTEPFKTEQANNTSVIADTARGKMVFINRCGRCHDLPLVSDFSTDKWEDILVTMIPKAKLNDAQVVHIKAWIYSHTGK